MIMRPMINGLMAALAILLLTSCAPGGIRAVSYHPAEGKAEIKENAKFQVARIVNSSNYKDDSFDITARMRTALENSLSKRNALAASEKDSDYKIAVNISKYTRGNAAARVFVAGAAATQLSVEGLLLDVDDESDFHAGMRAVYSIQGGSGIPLVATVQGIRTSGAWDSIFDEAAEELVELLTNRDFRKRRTGVDWSLSQLKRD
jgi:hypothetical protein